MTEQLEQLQKENEVLKARNAELKQQRTMLDAAFSRVKLVAEALTASHDTILYDLLMITEERDQLAEQQGSIAAVNAAELQSLKDQLAIERDNLSEQVQINESTQRIIAELREKANIPDEPIHAKVRRAPNLTPVN